MAKFEQHNINDFFKDSLKDYEATYNPEDWLEMEKKLDSAGLSNGIQQYTRAILAGTILIGVVVTSWILFDKAEPQPADSSDSAYENDQKKITPFNKLTRIKLNDKPLSSDPAGPELDKNPADQDKQSSAYEAPINKELTNEADQNSEVVTTVAADPVHSSQPEGPMLDMLRREHQEIQEMDAPKANFSINETAGCIPLTTRFKPGNNDIGTRYLWDFGDGFFSTDANPSHTYFNPGVYSVSLTVTSLINDKSTTIRNEKMISAYKVPEANFELLQDNTNGSGLNVTFLDQSINVVEWLWYFGDFETATGKNPSHNYSESGDYTVTLIGKNSDGCFDTTIGYISVSNREIANNLYTPTAFSPNGDGVNDEFKPIIADDENQSYEMTIYDRNGLVVFETKDVNKGWDGKIGEGELAPFGTYIWLVIINGDDRKEQKRLGQVTLLK